ncbi:hypothetical protein PA598K_02139 [Paenibacillus sp. 598K]|uniref:hypothetical protein n=1 Tax=Paenibacillus sp. 598K TaxID=1117987 RepID=UPI000FF9A986|nr:hypothetical protein [Paenibacillus sp. 598K]GBF73818.1 hypothetical protein PA598K_02139 [Paenibacillus sp. 598K]
MTAWRKLLPLAALLALLLSASYLLLESYSPAWNVWRDQRAYAKLGSYLASERAEDILLSVGQQVVASEELDALSEINYRGSLWDREEMRPDGALLVTVRIARAEPLFLYLSDDADFPLFDASYSGRRFVLELPGLTRLVRELRPQLSAD